MSHCAKSHRTTRKRRLLPFEIRRSGLRSLNADIALPYNRQKICSYCWSSRAKKKCVLFEGRKEDEKQSSVLPFLPTSHSSVLLQSPFALPSKHFARSCPSSFGRQEIARESFLSLLLSTT